jgi:Type II CAAX prenyl endopeptidase Rce1-like
MEDKSELTAKPGAWVDLGLTLPVFLVYHFGVVFLNIHNAADVVTFNLLRVAEGSRLLYLLFTASIGVVFVGIFAWLGRGHAFRPSKFIQIVIEGVVYAVLMRLAGSYVVGQVTGFIGADSPHVAATSHIAATSHLAATSHVAATSGAVSGVTSSATESVSPFTGLIMSMGAGFYEELAFRVLLFGLGAKALLWIFAHERVHVVEGKTGRLSFRALLLAAVWAVVCATVFSGIHYIGALGDSFHLGSFVFRLVLGLVLTLIYVTRGFAAAVWAHALYDVWVLVRIF